MPVHILLKIIKENPCYYSNGSHLILYLVYQVVEVFLSRLVVVLTRKTVVYELVALLAAPLSHYAQNLLG